MRSIWVARPSEGTGMLDFYETLAISILNIVLPYAITRRDRASLPKEQLARAWNTASYGSAVYFFGPLCLLAHFWVTRRRVWGLFVGGAWMLVVFAGEGAIGYVVDLISG